LIGCRFAREQGITLMETLVAIFILATVGMTITASMYTIVKNDEVARIHISAESLVRNELEYVKAIDYLKAPWEYQLPGNPPSFDLNHNSLPDGYDGYAVSVVAEAIPGCDDDIQKITASVTYHGQQVLRIETYRNK